MRCYPEPKLSSNTFRDYFNPFRKFREFLGEDLPIQSIQIENIAGFNNQNQHLKKKTLKIIIRVFPLSTWSSNIWQSPRWISNPPIVVSAWWQTGVCRIMAKSRKEHRHCRHPTTMDLELSHNYNNSGPPTFWLLSQSRHNPNLDSNRKILAGRLESE